MSLSIFICRLFTTTKISTNINPTHINPYPFIPAQTRLFAGSTLNHDNSWYNSQTKCLHMTRLSALGLRRTQMGTTVKIWTCAIYFSIRCQNQIQEQHTFRLLTKNRTTWSSTFSWICVSISKSYVTFSCRIYLTGDNDILIKMCRIIAA